MVAATTADIYQRALVHFDAWCSEHGLSKSSIGSLNVCDYMRHLYDSGASISRIGVIVSAISWRNKQSGLMDFMFSDDVRQTRIGIRRKTKSNVVRKATPLVGESVSEDSVTIQRVVKIIGETEISDIRDRAILLLGFGGGFRRSELAALKFSDLKFEHDYLDVTIRKSKTDQAGHGRVVRILPGEAGYCPVASVQLWMRTLEAAIGSVSGEAPLFVGFRSAGRHADGKVPRSEHISTHAINHIIKARVSAVGLDASKFSGNSLRRGYATTAMRVGYSPWAVQGHLGHANIGQTFDYAEPFVDGNRYVTDGLL
jgi:site-specific recombinase XerD